MAITVIGSQAVLLEAAENPAGVTVTVPSGTTSAYMFWQWNNENVNSTIAGVTLGGSSYDHLFAIDPAALTWSTGVAAWGTPAIGGQTLDILWDASGGAMTEGPVVVMVYLSGAVTGWRDADAEGNLGEFTAISVTVTSVAGDFVVKFDAKDLIVPGLSAGWASIVTTTHGDSNVDGARLSSITASGATTVCNCENEAWSSIVAISIEPATVSADLFNIPGTRMYVLP